MYGLVLGSTSSKRKEAAVTSLVEARICSTHQEDLRKPLASAEA